MVQVKHSCLANDAACTLWFSQSLPDELFSEALYEGMGLTARMLVVAPDSTAGTRFFSEAPKEAGKALEDYYLRIRNLLQRPPVTKSDAPDILNPLALRLCDAAKSEWIVFHDECESMVIEGEYLAPIRGFAAKLAEHARTPCSYLDGL